MSTVVVDAVIELEQFESELREHVFRRDAPVGLDALGELAGETRNKLIDLSARQIQLELTPALTDELRAYVLHAIQELNAAARSDDADAQQRHLAQTLVELEAARHILRDGIDHEPLRTEHPDGSAFLSRAAALEHLTKWLPRLATPDHAELLGIDDRQARRWRTDDKKPATERAELVTELVGILRHSWTNEGVRRWFNRRHPLLDNHTPNDVLTLLEHPDDDRGDPAIDWERRLRDAATATRSQTAI